MSPRFLLVLVPALLAIPSTVEAQQRVEVKRMQVRLIEPQQYRVTLQLEPLTLVDLVAPADGYLRTMVHRAGDDVDREAEIARMENAEAQFALERSKALARVAEIQLDIAKDSGETRSIELAQANVEAAVAQRQLDQLRFDRTTIRSPLSGIVFSAEPSPGRFLRAGDVIATVGDTKMLKVEVPMARADAAEGTEIDLVVADKTVKARIDSVQPLAPKFDALRDIVTDVVSAIVVVDNSKGGFAIGQTVRSPLMPEHPIVVVPNSSIGELPDDAGRRVQVIRNDVVTDVPVSVLAGIGEETSYIAGPLVETDELITSSSIELTDGIQVRRAATPEATAANPAATRPVRRRRDDD